MENIFVTNEQIKDFRLPRYKELPDMGLYLEQIVRYINGCLSPLGCVEITSSMISNYVKKGLVANPVKKLYYAEHLAKLLFIVLWKSVLSIEYIGKLLQLMEKGTTNHEVYDYCCTEFENRLFYVFGLRDDIPESDAEESDAKMMLDEVVTAVAFSIHLSACFRELDRE